MVEQEKIEHQLLIPPLTYLKADMHILRIHNVLSCLKLFKGRENGRGGMPRNKFCFHLNHTPMYDHIQI